MANNTGNPVEPNGSDDPRDLIDNAKIADLVVNSQENTTTDRLGRVILTLKGMSNSAGDATIAIQAAQDSLTYSQAAQAAAENVEANASEIAAEAAATVIEQVNVSVQIAQSAADSAQLNGGVYQDTTAGIAGTTNGEYFSVVSPESAEYLILYRNSAGSAVEQKRYPSAQIDSLTINRGRAYPLRKMTRNSVTSGEPVGFSKAILNICIIGARAGKYYRLAYFVNGSTAVPSAKPDGWTIEEINQANYSSAANAATNVISITDDTTPVIPREGIQTVVLSSSVVPDLRILITLDTAQLPAYGTFISANTSRLPGYSYIIDPSRYIPTENDSTDSININSGQVAPFRLVSRGGAISTPNALQTKVILNVRVLNAKRGKYYGLRYFQNGSAAVVPAADNWIIEEIDIVGYDASVITSANSIAGLADAQPVLDRTLGIQTVLLNTKSDVRVQVTLDASKLAAYGTVYGMNAAHQQGYSLVIDPACYEVAAGNVATGSRVSYQVDVDGRVALSWTDGEVTRGFVFGDAGANDLPNFYQLLRNGGVLAAYGTDWLPPITFEAAANGDGRVPLEFTGGNHLIDGAKTAINDLLIIEADGVPVFPGDSGTADQITCRVINKLMANNTVSLNRYPLLQSFQVDFKPGVANVHMEALALEDLHMYVDYACQIVTTAVNDTLFYLGGQLPEPVPFDSTLNSGSPSAYPDAWAVLTSSAHGQLAAWVDRDYGIADGSQVYEGYGMIIGGGGSSTKQYTTAIHRFLQRNAESPNYMLLPAGTSYKWRGGYSWGSVQTPAGFVASLQYLDNGRIRRADALSSSRVLNP